MAFCPVVASSTRITSWGARQPFVDRFPDFSKLIHQVFFGMQPAGSIYDGKVDIFLDGIITVSYATEAGSTFMPFE